jgi:hypothetical protein
MTEITPDSSSQKDANDSADTASKKGQKTCLLQKKVISDVSLEIMVIRVICVEVEAKGSPRRAPNDNLIHLFIAICLSL